MGLFSAMGVGVLGLDAQSTKLDIISQNISNVNTVGYKAGVARFYDLIAKDNVPGYNNLGVNVINQQQISQQGLIVQTNSSTDIAVNGNGFFIVNTKSDGTGQVEYTRAGSFTPDKDGFYKNSYGLFLEGYLLDRSGNPAANLTTINVANISGAATATNAIQLGINLNASQTNYPGAGATADIDNGDPLNNNNNSTQIISPSTIDHLTRGDVFNVTSGAGASYNYKYGGFTIGRNVTDGTPTGNGDNGENRPLAAISLGNSLRSVGSGSGDIIVTVPSTAGMRTGDVVNIAGATAVGGITAPQINGNFTITVLSSTTYKINTAGADPTVGGSAGGGPAATETFVPLSPIGLANPFQTVGGGSADVIVTVPTTANMQTGDVVNLTSAAGAGGITNAQLSGNFVITVLSPTTYRITTLGTDPTPGGSPGGGAVTQQSEPTSPTVLNNPFQSVGGGSGDVVVTVPTTAGMRTGDVVNISGAAALGGITAPQINGSFTITVLSPTTYRITTTGIDPTAGGTAGGGLGVNQQSLQISPQPLTNPFQTVGGGSGDVVVTVPTTAGLRTGDVVSFSGATGVGGITAAQMNSSFVITVLSPTSYRITTAGSDPAVGGTSGGGAGVNQLSAPASPIALGSPFKTVGGGSGDVIVTVPSTANMHTGDVVTLSGATAVGGITAAQLTGRFIITVLNSTSYQITTTGSDPAVGGTVGGGTSVIENLRPYVGNILDATNSNTPFLSLTGTTNILPAALKFTITTAATGTKTFTYTSAAPDVVNGQFNTMNNLVDAINNVPGLTARLVNGRLEVGAADSNAAVTFANGQATGATTTSGVQSGLDWIGELGLSNVSADTNRFSTLDSLAKLVNASPGLTATVNNPLGPGSTVSINLKDPTDTITFKDRDVVPPVTLGANAFTTTNGSNLVTVSASIAGLQPGDTVTLSNIPAGLYNGIPAAALNGTFYVQSVGSGSFTIAVGATPDNITAGTFGAGGETASATNIGSVIAELGIVPSLNGNPFPVANPVPTTGILGPAYDATDVTKNMAGGNIVPQFSRNITVYDTLGDAHNVTVGFIKTDINTWAAEVYASPASDAPGSPGGQLAAGTITFNGDATLATIDPALTTPLAITWANGSTNTIAVDWGAVGTTSGLGQYAGQYNVAFTTQNGAPVGHLSRVSIDSSGTLIATYDNGQNQSLYRIPLADFNSPDSLQGITGTAFLETQASGAAVVKTAGTNGVGFIAPSQLESSNADLGTQLTDMIVAQRAYQFNTKLITTSDEMLQNLTQMGAP